MGHDELFAGVRITGLLVATKQLAGFSPLSQAVLPLRERSVILNIRLEVEGKRQGRRSLFVGVAHARQNKLGINSSLVILVDGGLIAKKVKVMPT